MNERIKELAKQCQNNDGTVEWQSFAELIVRECIEQIDDVINDTGSNGAYLAYKRVKEHFGVEE